MYLFIEAVDFSYRVLRDASCVAIINLLQCQDTHYAIRHTQYEIMIFKRRCEIAKGKLDIAPMIDVVLLLLIFFMLSSSMILPMALKLNLPRTAASSAQRGKRIRVTIDRSGALFWQGARVEVAELENRLAELSATERETLIVLEADRDVAHGRVVEVMGMARTHGLTRLAIATAPGKE